MKEVRCPKCRSVMKLGKIRASVADGTLESESKPTFGKTKRRYLNVFKCTKCGHKVLQMK